MSQKTGKPRYRHPSSSSSSPTTGNHLTSSFSSSRRDTPRPLPSKRVTRTVNVLKRCSSVPASLSRIGGDVEGHDKESMAKGDVARSFTFNHGPLFRGNTCTDVLLSHSSSCSPEGYKKDAKVVVNVTVEGSPGPIRTMVRLGCSVEDTILAVVDRYGQEGRTPKLHRDSITGYELHNSYFSLQSLEKSECIGGVGSRSFYLRTSSNNSVSPSANPLPPVIPPLFMVLTFIARKIERRARKLWKVVICSSTQVPVAVLITSSLPRRSFLEASQPPSPSERTAFSMPPVTIQNVNHDYYLWPCHGRWRMWLWPEAKACQRPRQRKLLVHVTVGRCTGAVRIVMSLEDTVEDLVAATVEAYIKEMRRPLLREKDPRRYRLHYSSFCLKSLEPNENVMKLGSRNFFLCTNTTSSSINPNCYENATLRSNPPSFSIANLIDLLMFSSWP